MRKDNEPAPDPHAVEDFSLTRGDDLGEVSGHFHAVKGARGYTMRTCYGESPAPVTGDEGWTSGPKTFFKSRFDAPGFDSGKRLWMQVRAEGTDVPGPWSQPVTIIVP